MQRGILAKAVSDMRAGLQAQTAQQSQNGQRDRSDGGLCDVGAGQAGGLILGNIWVQRRDRVDQCAKRLGRATLKPLAGLFQRLAHDGKVHGQPRRHAGVLRALTREQQRHLIGRQRVAECQVTAARIGAAGHAIGSRG